MPESAELTLTIPPQMGRLDQQDYSAQLASRIEEKERDIRAEMKKNGRSFLGVKGIMKQRHTDKPNSKEPRRNLNPQVACKSKWHRIEALRRLKSFLLEYRYALSRWRDGDKNVEFPAGTYMLRIHAGVCCAHASP